jgi:hypothetical protein
MIILALVRRAIKLDVYDFSNTTDEDFIITNSTALINANDVNANAAYWYSLTIRDPLYIFILIF